MPPVGGYFLFRIDGGAPVPLFHSANPRQGSYPGRLSSKQGVGARDGSAPLQMNSCQLLVIGFVSILHVDPDPTRPQPTVTLATTSTLWWRFSAKQEKGWPKG